MIKRKPTVGETLYIQNTGNKVNSRNPIQLAPVQVMQVGRKYFFVARDGYKDSQHCWEKFTIEGWKQPTRYSADWLLFEDPQAWEDMRQKGSLTEEIRENMKSWGEVPYSLDQLERINTIMQEEIINE